MKVSDFTIKTLKQGDSATGWKVIGPGGGGGQFYPAISPHNPDIMLVRCDMTGSYITHNGGRSWEQFNLRTVSEAFCFDPVNPDVIYAGACGLYRTEDSGETWVQIFPKPEDVLEEAMVGDHADYHLVAKDGIHLRICTVTVHPYDADSIYTSAVMIDREGTRRICLFHSGDKGLTWNRIAHLEGRTVHKVFILPDSSVQNPSLLIATNKKVYMLSEGGASLKEIGLPDAGEDILHAACGLNPATGRVVIYLTTKARWEGERYITGVWKSVDEGQTWQMLKDGLDTNLAGPQSGKEPFFNQLAVPESDARVVYLTVERYPWVQGSHIINYFGVVKSVDEGQTWRWVFKSDYEHNPENVLVGWAERDYDMPWFGKGPKGFWPLTLGVSNVNPQICVYTDFSSTIRTDDGGKTWRQLYSIDHPDGSVSTNGMDVTTSYGVHFDPFDKKHIAISYTDIGLFHSKDGGSTWFHSMNGITAEFGNTCYWLVFDPEIKGRAWSVWSNAHDLPRPKMFRTGRTGWYRGVVCRTDDGMNSWKVTSDGIDRNCSPTCIILDPKSPAGNRTLYVAAFLKGVYKSVDDGKTWTLKNNGIEGNLFAWHITMLPDGTLYLLVARGAENGQEVDGAIYRSTDGAEHWEKMPMPEGANAPNDLAFDPSDPKRMYLACWPRTLGGKEHFGGLYVTEDGGYSWKNTFDQTKHVYGVTVDPDNPSTIYINTFNSAAYRSDDRGSSWKKLKTYDFKWGHRPILDPHNKEMIYLTTFGGSVWYGPRDAE